MRELSVLRACAHPNVVTLLDVLHIPSEDKLLMIFEYIPRDLRCALDERMAATATGATHTPARSRDIDATRGTTSGFSSDEVKSLMYQLLCGVAHLHRARSIHRDLKPQNLLLTADGTLKIADFGLSRLHHVPVKRYTHETITLWYRPPEILLGSSHYTPAVDMWSVGCIFAELVTGHALFNKSGEYETLNAIFRLLGTPSADTWPGIHACAAWGSMTTAAAAASAAGAPAANSIQFPRWRPRPLDAVFPSLDATGVELLQAMLSVDPSTRISAARALQHPYFFSITGTHAKLSVGAMRWKVTDPTASAIETPPEIVDNSDL